MTKIKFMFFALGFMIVVWEFWLWVFAIQIFTSLDGQKGYDYWVQLDLFNALYKLL
jgi:hypothetical protein